MFAKRKEYEEVDLNLIPIMNLFVALIPFLLLSAVFFHLRVIKGSVPAATEGQTDIAKGDDTVTMTVQIDPKDGFLVSASSATLHPDETNKLARSFPKKGGDYDFAALSSYMREVKRKWDKSDTVIIVSDPTVKYKELVETMDAARELEIEIGGKKQRYIMFPRVVVSSLVT
ncbi:MAG: biopolymer transporter ExbD [Pseudomonadota bacterium]